MRYAVHRVKTGEAHNLEDDVEVLDQLLLLLRLHVWLGFEVEGAGCRRI